MDTQFARLCSARGLPCEWSDFTRLKKWMSEQGFWYWWMRNDLEPSMVMQTEEGTKIDMPSKKDDLMGPQSKD